MARFASKYKPRLTQGGVHDSYRTQHAVVVPFCPLLYLGTFIVPIVRMIPSSTATGSGGAPLCEY